MVLERGKKTLVPFSRSSLAPKERFTYYDQRHTTGSDIKQATLAHAFVTIGRYTTLRDILQGPWRMRGLDKAQKVTFLVSDAQSLLMKQTLHLPEKTPIRLEHILCFAIGNQDKQKNKHIVTAMKQKISHVACQEAFNRLLNAKIVITEIPAENSKSSGSKKDGQSAKKSLDIESLKNIFLNNKDLFLLSVKDTPYATFGGSKKEIQKDQVINRYIDLKLKNVQDKNGDLKSKMLEVAKVELLPDKLPAFVDESNETTVEVEREQEMEQEVENEEDCQTSKERCFPIYYRKELQDKIYGKELYETTHPKDFMEKGKKHFYSSYEEDEAKKPFIVTIPHVFSNDEGVSPYQDIFDDKLCLTTNFFPVRSYGSIYGECGMQNHKLFHKKHKEAKSFLVISDKKTKEIKVLFVSKDDIAFFIDAMKKDKLGIHDIPENKRELKLALYERGIGVFQTGKFALKREEIEKHPEFNKLYVQIKFLNGDHYYSDEEQKVLKVWILEKGIKRMKKLFVDHILANRSMKRGTYKKSMLCKIFEELEGAVV